MLSEFSLPNEVRILTDEMPDVGSVSVAIAAGIGGRHETPDSSGISHFVEHMAFKGTKNMNAREIAEFFDGFGAQYNAYTSNETTVFYFKILAEYWERAAEALMDMVFDSTYPADELDREKGVILEEINESNDDPSDSAYELYMAQVYKDQQLGRPILGYKSTVKSMSCAGISSFVRNNYVGRNVVVGVSGNVRHDDVISVLQPRLSKISSGARVAPENTTYVGGYASEKRTLEQLQLNFGFPGVSVLDDNYYSYRLAAIILGGGMSSRLFQEAREKRGLAYSIHAHSSSYNGCGHLSINSSTSPDNASELIKVSMGQIADMANSVSEAELSRAKNAIKSSALLKREDSMSRALYACNSLLTHDRYISIDEMKRKIDTVSTGDIQRVISSALSSKKHAMAVLGNFSDEIDYCKLV